MSRFFQIQSSADERGQTLVEYSLILAFVAVLCLAALNILGTAVASMLESVANQI